MSCSCRALAAMLPRRLLKLFGQRRRVLALRASCKSPWLAARAQGAADGGPQLAVAAVLAQFERRIAEQCQAWEPPRTASPTRSCVATETRPRSCAHALFSCARAFSWAFPAVPMGSSGLVCHRRQLPQRGAACQCRCGFQQRRGSAAVGKRVRLPRVRACLNESF